MRPSNARLVQVGVAIPATIVVAGFWFHTSPYGAAILGKYSVPYLALAIGATVLGVGAVLVAGFLARPQEIHLPSGRSLTVPLAIKASIVIVAIAAAFLAAEIGLTVRAARAERLVVRAATFHPFLQAIPAPGDERLRINRWGFRGEEIELEKPAGTFRIFVLGGSTVYCDRVGFEDSHCRILEKRLRAEMPGIRIEVQNAGMHWHTSAHSLFKFLTDVQDFDPDLVVAYHGVNDLCRSFSPPRFARGPFRRDYGHFDGPIAEMVRNHFGLDGGTRFHVVNAVVERVDRYWFSDLRRNTPSMRRRHPETVTVETFPSLESFRRNMTALVLAARQRGIPVVLASQPYLYKVEMTERERRSLWFTKSSARDEFERPDTESMRLGMAAFARVSREVAETTGAPFVDLEAAVPKDSEHFLDDVHYTVAGNRVVGDTLASFLLEEGLVGSTRGTGEHPPDGDRK